MISKSIKKTHKLAEQILKDLILQHKLNQALIIVLKGELGAGKTEFVKGLKKFLKINNNILSPTFVLMKVYIINNAKINFKNLYHFDLYRLIENDKCIVESLNILNIYDILNNKDNIIFVEWGENIKMLKKFKIHTIEIKRKNILEREINLKTIDF